ncbi:hypothetical protein ACHAXT_011991 [Thalassiosira profunda]
MATSVKEALGEVVVRLPLLPHKSPIDVRWPNDTFHSGLLPQLLARVDNALLPAAAQYSVPPPFPRGVLHPRQPIPSFGRRRGRRRRQGGGYDRPRQLHAGDGLGRRGERGGGRRVHPPHPPAAGATLVTTAVAASKKVAKLPKKAGRSVKCTVGASQALGHKRYGPSKKNHKGQGIANVAAGKRNFRKRSSYPRALHAERRARGKQIGQKLAAECDNPDSPHITWFVMWVGWFTWVYGFKTTKPRRSRRRSDRRPLPLVDAMGSSLSRWFNGAQSPATEKDDASLAAELDGDDSADLECEAPDQSEARHNKRDRYKYEKYAYDIECHKKDATVQAIKEMLTENVGTPIVEAKKAYRPGTDIDELANLYRLELQNTPFAGVYYVIDTGKVGFYRRGKVRASFYSPEDGIIIVIFYYDHADDDVLSKLGQAIEDIGMMEHVHLDPEVVENLSIEDAIEMNDGPGPSILFRLFLHSMTHTSGESRLGGGAEVKGARRALDLLNAETALFGALKEMWVNVDDKSAMDEHLHSKLPAYYTKANAASLKGGKGFFRKMERRGLLEVALQEIHKIHATLAWTPFKKEDQLLDTCKVLIVKAIIGVSHLANSDDYWHDAMGEDVTPPDGPYVPSSYRMGQHLRPGFSRIKADVMGVETSTTHVFKLLDSNQLIMSKVVGKTMVEWLLGRKWEIFYTHLNVVVMYLDQGDDIVRMLFVVGPLCYMLYAGAYTDEDGNERQPTVEERDAEAMRAEEAQFLIIVFDVLRGNHSELEIGDILPPQTIFRNPIWAFITKEFTRDNVHLYRVMANCWPKSLLGNCNALDTQYHRMPARQHIFLDPSGPERQNMLDRFFYYYFPEKDNTIRVEMNAYLKQLEEEREDVIGDEAEEHAKRKMREADDAEQERQRKAKERRKKK